MSEIKLLLVEDDSADRATCAATVRRIQVEKSLTIRLEEATSKDEALSMLSNDFDGAIIDLRLCGDSEAGSALINEIHSKWRFPIAVFTGTPSHLDAPTGIVEIYTKGEVGYDQVITRLIDISDTGITRIFGGRGALETELNRVFWDAVLPSMKQWVAHRKTGKVTEEALLRFVASQLIEYLRAASDTYFPEEFYVLPRPHVGSGPVSRRLACGCVVNKKTSKEGEGAYVVLSPACDLAVHNDSIKTDRILVCAVHGFNDHHAITRAQKMCNTALPVEGEAGTEEAAEKRAAGLDQLKRLCSNNHCQFLHFLPAVKHFDGGLLDFRRLQVFKPKEFDQEFTAPSLQISALFIKDIVSRFSSYYARQGQPNLDADAMAEVLKTAT